MKKALIITNLSGFLLKFEIDNVKLLQALGYEVHFASNMNEKGYSFEKEDLDALGVIFHQIQIARSPYMIKMNMNALRQLRKIVKEERIELIHCHTPVGGLLGRIVSKKRTKDGYPKVIYTAHGFHFYKGAPLINNVLFKAVEYGLAPLTDVLIVINNEDYLQAKKMKLRNKHNVYNIPGVGVDLEKFCPVDYDEKIFLREKYGISTDKFLILSVGELNLNKNHQTIIDMMYQMKTQGIGNDIIYGICGDGYFRNAIEMYSKKKNLYDRVHFFGYQKNIRDYYAMADIVVFPSKREGLGMVGVEALAMGVPVIASDNRGTREYMVDGENGYVCKWNDVTAFQDAVFKVKNMPLSELCEMQKRCRNSIGKFELSITHKIMKMVYESLRRELDQDDK